MSTTADLVRRSRLALRLPAQRPGVRHRPVHDWLRAVPTAAASEDAPADPIKTIDAVVRRLFGAVSQSELGADALAAARRISTATLPVLRRFLVLALVAVATLAALATIGATALQSAVHTVTPDPQVAVEATRVAAAVRSQTSAVDPAGLRVHVQKQTFLHAGGERQFRISVDGELGLDRSRDADVGAPLMLVELAIHKEQSGDGSVSVTPTQLVVTRSELRLTPIWIQVGAGAPCGSNLGELHVRVRELASERSRGATTIALPPVDCRAGPPAVGEPREIAIASKRGRDK